MSRPGSSKSKSREWVSKSGNGAGHADPGEPIAIIGMGCRFPGAPDPEALWQVLRDGVDCIDEVPRHRFPEIDDFYDPTPGTPGKIITREGGYLEHIDGFDPLFFGVSPREATYMDPQQRLLLEVGWEAIEDAGLPIENLSRSRTGVFVGLWTSDYEVEMLRARSEIDLYMTTGGSNYSAAGRMSYLFDLQGPSLVADTACSTSLVTAHLACQSLRSGESELALAGGVNLIMQPPITIAFSKAGMLSPDGRCKFADASANGYVRSEGCGIVVLKPLSKAEADGDRIYATILGSAVNSDGQEGMFVAPSQGGQEKMLRQAYRSAGRSAKDVVYMEAHGTGTGVGDPTEMGALGAVLSEDRPSDRPCIVGSVKTNIGHTETAAGVAGLMKAALCLERSAIPPTLHFKTPNPEIPWNDLPFELPTEFVPMPNGGEPALVGVNSFGISGTNAHMVLEGHAAVDNADAATTRGTYLLPVSARSDDALGAMASSWADFLRDLDPDEHTLANICYTASVRRSHHDKRLAVTGMNAGELIQGLEAAARGEAVPGLLGGPQEEVRTTPSVDPVFVFAGQGPQWWAMGRRLFETEPVYRSMVERIDALAIPISGWSIVAELGADETASRLDDTEIAQPALFALQMGLDALWRSWGIQPGAIVGHSLGEVAACCAAGVLSLEDAVRVVVCRGRQLQGATGLGKMAAAELTPTEAEAIVGDYEGQVELAAINAPESVTLSGEADPLAQILIALEKDEKFCQLLPVNYAFHSPQVAPFAVQLRGELEGISLHAPRTTLYSTVTGQEVAAGDYGPEYWSRNVREHVQFGPVIDALIEAGHRTFLELSPHPALMYSVGQCLSHRGESGTTIPSLRRDAEIETTLSSLGALYVHGMQVDWSGLYPDGGRCVSLPTYAWQRDRYWFEPGEGSAIIDRSTTLASSGSGRSMLGNAFRSADDSGRFYWEKMVSAAAPSFLTDHRVEDAVTFPAAAYVDMALSAAQDAFGDGLHELADMKFERALSMGDDEARLLQMSFEMEAPGTFGCRFHSRDGGGESNDWTHHASGSVRLDGSENEDSGPPHTLESLKKDAGATQTDHYADMAERGLNYGPAFRAVDEAWCGDGWVAGRLLTPVNADWSSDDYRGNPGVWDAGFQLMVSLAPKSDQPRRDTYLPVGINRIRRCKPFADAEGLWAYVTLNHATEDELDGNVLFLDAAGQTVAEARGLRLLRLERTRQGNVRDWLYDIQWEALESEAQLQANGVGAKPELTPLAKIDAAAVSRRMAKLAVNDELRHEGRRANEVGPELDRLCAAYAQQALKRLGWNFDKGHKAPSHDLAKQLRVVDSQAQMLDRIFEILAQDGLLKRESDNWLVLQELSEVTASSLYDTLTEQFPDFRAELDFLLMCGEALPEVLNGSTDPLELLFSEESTPGLEHLYRDTNRGPNELARQAFEQLVAAWPDREKIRVLEIGAGTGGTTQAVLPTLPADRTDYVFTDVSPAFLDKASEKFSDFPFLRTELFDAEKDPEAQGFASGDFDIVLASNVLHATADMRETLGNARRLLAPNGVVVLIEGVQPTRWVDMIFGLTEGWWRFSDTELRPAHPLMPVETWAQALAETDFEESAAVTGSDAFGGALYEQAVILARAPENSQSPALSRSAEDWLIFADEGGAGDSLAEMLRDEGANCQLVYARDSFEQASDNRWYLDPAASGDFERILDSTLPLDRTAPSGVVHLWALDAPEIGDGTAAGDEAQARQDGICGTALRLTRALAAREAQVSPHLWFVTRGAQPVGGSAAPLAPSQAPLWGMAKVVGLEHPELACGLMDLDPACGGDDAPALLRALALARAKVPERWMAVREGRLFGARLARFGVTASGGEDRLELPSNHAYQLQIPTRGTLDNLVLAPVGRRIPKKGEVEVRVLATGQNFRDVLNALGMYPGDPGPLGLECAGVIAAVGEGVDGLRVGDSVVALARASFASFTTVPAELVVPLPDCLSYEQAAAIPVVYLTAHYALRRLASIKKGDRVLVHAASGGVGIAAVQIALSAGAIVFGTAGNPAKRATLEAMGVHHVMDSRSLDFADTIEEITKGKGVDIVLNSLAGDFITRSFDVLADDGTFVEIGKAGVWTHEQARAAKKNCAYHLFDLTEAMRDEQDKVGAAFRELVDNFETGALTAPPVQTFPIEETISAFRTMSQAKHIGKIVITQSDSPTTGEAVPSLGFRAEGTYLITGGFGGLGLLVARWMVEHGARELVLTGRSAPSQEAEGVLADLRQQGVNVRTAQVDVSVGKDVARLLADIDRDGSPLVGVLHCAGVLDDGVLLQQSWDRIWKVLSPKVAGGWHLHNLTRDMPLETFVLFSSWCAVLGSPGQANHCAANAFLDTLAHYRRADGLPALSVNWGAWAEVGAAARVDRSENLGRRGIGNFTPDQGLDAMELLLSEGATQSAVVPFELELWRQFDPLGSQSHLFDLLADESAETGGKSEAADDVRQALDDAAPGQQRLEVMEGHLGKQVAQVLRIPASRIDRERPFKALGLDSLTGLELRNRLEASLQLKLPGTLVWNYSSVEKLGEYLLGRIEIPADAAAQAAEPDDNADRAAPLDDLLDELESVSDEEARRLLAEEDHQGVTE
jgi:acyl transferase domain-containing protein/acyl carrier protein